MLGIYERILKLMLSIQPVRQINPFPPSVLIWHRLAKILVLIWEGIIKNKNSYESIDEKTLF